MAVLGNTTRNNEEKTQIKAETLTITWIRVAIVEAAPTIKEIKIENTARITTKEMTKETGKETGTTMALRNVSSHCSYGFFLHEVVCIFQEELLY